MKNKPKDNMPQSSIGRWLQNEAHQTDEPKALTKKKTTKEAPKKGK